MTIIEIMLLFICIMLVYIWYYVRLIYLNSDPQRPVNCYGESFTDAIQNSHARGLKGIDTYGSF